MFLCAEQLPHPALISPNPRGNALLLPFHKINTMLQKLIESAIDLAGRHIHHPSRAPTSQRGHRTGQQSNPPISAVITRPGHLSVSVNTEQASNRTRQSAQSPPGQGSYRSASHHSTKASIDKRSHRVRPLQVIPTHTTALLTTTSTNTARPKRKQVCPVFSFSWHSS